eukprot:6205428-Pleurochrysis_carterae.AAC.1
MCKQGGGKHARMHATTQRHRRGGFAHLLTVSRQLWRLDFRRSAACSEAAPKPLAARTGAVHTALAR